MSLKHADDKSDTIVVNSWKINSFATGNIQLCCRIFETATTIIKHRTIIMQRTIIKQRVPKKYFTTSNSEEMTP